MNLKRILTKHNKGISLVELIVTIAVMSFVAVGISVALVSATRTYNMGNTEVDLQQEVQNITNILNNLVLDADLAENKSLNDDGTLAVDTSNSNLFIKSSNGGFYLLSWDKASELSYIKLTYDETTDKYSYNPDTDKYPISKSVKSFVAKPGDFKSDYTVDFDLSFKSEVVGVKASARTMNTSFLAMSRNGKATKAETEENSAVVVVEKEAIIEPNQSIEIPFDILISGDMSGVSYSVVPSGVSYTTESLDNDKDIVGFSYTSDLSANYKCIKFTAQNSLKDDFTLKINVTGKSGTGYDSPVTVNVHVRRVTNISVLGKCEKGEYAKNSSQYLIHPSITCNNKERYFELIMDDDYKTYDVSKVKVLVGGSYSINSVKYVIVDADGKVPISDTEKKLLSDISDTSIIKWKEASSIGLDGETIQDGQSFYIQLTADMNKNDSVTIKMCAAHSGYKGEKGDLNSAINKTYKKYDTVEDEYIIKPSIFPEGSGFKRGADEGEPAHGSIPSVNDKVKEYIEEYFGDYYRSKFSDDTITDLEIFNNFNKENVRFSAFYSVGWDHKPETEDPEYTNNYYLEENDIRGSQRYWSQYRCLVDKSDSGDYNSMAYHLRKPGDGEPEGADSYDCNNGALRLIPDQEYTLEFVAVFYTVGDITINVKGYSMTIPARTILWPKYDRLTQLGFSSSGFGFSDAYTDDKEVEYSDYANQFPVGKAGINFISYTNAYDTSTNLNGSSNAGSESSPLILGKGNPYVTFNTADWTGIAKNPFMNRANGSLQVNRHDGNGWVFAGLSSVSGTESLEAGTKITAIGSSAKYTFDSQNTVDDSVNYYATFRVLCDLRQSTYYIKDSDGIFGSVYSDGVQKTYYYKDNDDNKYGYIYFTKYEKPITVQLIANGGTLEGTDSKVISYIVGSNSVLPVPSWDGKVFDGWYTSQDGGTKITYPSSSITLYAHWIEPVYSIDVSYAGQGTQYIYYPDAVFCKKYSITVSNIGPVDVQTIKINVSDDAVFHDISANVKAKEETVWEFSLYSVLKPGQSTTIYLNIEKGTVEGK